MNFLDLVRLSALMERTSGKAEMRVGLIDGPVAMSHPDLAGDAIRELPGTLRANCTQSKSLACMHGTFVAGILSAKRDSPIPGICPECILLVRPIFAESPRDGRMPSATPGELAAAIIACVEAGARAVNVSAALAQTSTRDERELKSALDHSARRGVIVVVAAGNQGTVGSSAITRHPLVIPVIACDLQGQPMNESNLGRSIGRRGLSAPGSQVTGLGADGKTLVLGGTSVAAPFVTGTIALLWSEFPAASLDSHGGETG